MYATQQLVKSIFRFVPELKSIPSKIQNAVANFMHVRKFKAEDLIISPDDKHPEAFIIAEGSCYYSQSKEQLQPKVSYLQENHRTSQKKQRRPKQILSGQMFGRLLRADKPKMETRKCYRG